MDECKGTEERQTLIQTFEKLDARCSQLIEVAGLTELLQEKLNRTEGMPKVNEPLAQKESVEKRNIVELFNLIADKMETQINIIGNNTEKSIRMIE